MITMVERTCLHCGESFTVRLAVVKVGKGKFCSIACHFAHVRAVPPEQRFWPKVNRNGPIPSHRPELGPCWEWTGRRSDGGYGRFQIGGKEAYAHRVAYAMAHGEIPEEKIVCHHCDNPPCVRDSHLFLGTDADNSKDALAKGRLSGPKGEANLQSKLNPDSVRQIRLRYAAGGVSYSVLAKDYGVHPSQIGAVILGKSWKHIGEGGVSDESH